MKGWALWIYGTLCVIACLLDLLSWYMKWPSSISTAAWPLMALSNALTAQRYAHMAGYKSLL